MKDYTQLIERLRVGTGGGKHWMELESEAADAIEALQSRCVELEGRAVQLTEWQNLEAERDNAVRMLAVACFERNSAMARLAAIGSQEPVAWIKYLIGAECKTDGRTYDILFCPMDGYTPLYANPVLAAGAQSPTALELMKSYSDGKAWALEEAERVCKKMECSIDGGGNTYYRPADARQCVEAIRKIAG